MVALDCWLLWCGCAAALSPDLTLKQLHHTAWGPGQGVPLGGAIELAQTNEGYLWIAGPSGLFRFDGIAFERIELPTTEAFFVESALGLCAARRWLVGRLHVWRRSAPQGGRGRYQRRRWGPARISVAVCRDAGRHAVGCNEQ